MKTGLLFRSSWNLLPILLAVAFATGCGGGPTSPPQNSTKATLSLNASALDFGAVSVGASETMKMTISNSSSVAGQNITVMQMTTTGTGFSVTSSPSSPFTLGAGQSATVSVTFAPKSGGPANGALTVSGDQVSSPASVPLLGNGLAQGQLAVTPSTMNFGSVTVNTSATLTGTLTAGSTDIQVASAGWSGTGYTVDGITFPVTVAAGSSVPFTVTFTPQTAGTLNGSVSFISNATNSPTVENFTGNGTAAPPHTVTLSWAASTSTVIGYNIYRTTQSGSYSSPLNSSPQSALTYTDSTVQGGTTYYYVVTSVDSGSRESIHSNEVVVAVP